MKTEICKAGEKALCYIYRSKHIESLDELRCKQFCQKAVHPRILPPTSAAAIDHSHRVYTQVQQWIGNDIDPTEWGWKLDSNILAPITTLRQPAPISLLKIIRCGCKLDCTSKSCSCKKHGLNCTPACSECRGDACSNSQSIDHDSIVEL